MVMTQDEGGSSAVWCQRDKYYLKEHAMKKETLTALRKSIEHWRENSTAQFSNVRVHSEACALCARFYGEHECKRTYGGRSELCPVHMNTGYLYCIRSPWSVASAAYKEWREKRNKSTRDAFRRAAINELRFLEKLLPNPAAKNKK